MAPTVGFRGVRPAVWADSTRVRSLNIRSLKMKKTLLATATLAAAVSLVLSAVASAHQKPKTRNDQKSDQRKPKVTKDLAGPAEGKSDTAMPALRFKMKDIDGKVRDLADGHGKVILMVNTASRCGLTPQYADIEKLYRKYKDDGFAVWAFPANNFGGQEPGSNEQIKAFCKQEYSVTFPVFAKVSVKGKDQCDLFKYLTAAEAVHEFGGDIRWNFNKFLISRSGEVIGRFEPRVKPLDEKVTAAIKKALAAPAPDKSHEKSGKPKNPR